MDRVEAHRLLFAKLITANAGIAAGSELEAAFASTPREQFVGPPPWRIFTRSGYVESPTADPAMLYQDVVISLGGEGPFNNGQPTLHAFCLAALNTVSGRCHRPCRRWHRLLHDFDGEAGGRVRQGGCLRDRTGVFAACHQLPGRVPFCHGA